jgi:plastocyanin
MRFGGKFLAAIAVLGLLAAGCGDDDGDGGDTAATTTTAADDGAEAGGPITIGIDGKSDAVNMSAFHYFPDKVKAHAGDTLVYQSNFTGEPHSITFGKSISEAIDLVNSVPLEVQQSDGPPPAEYEETFARVDEIFSSLPAMLPEGPGDANQISVNPCFITTGEIPTDATQPCEVQEPEPFTGTETFYNSGFLPDGATFEMQLADDLAPGTYIGMCILHFTEMTSTIEVVADDVDIPDAAAVAEEGQQQLDEFSSALATAVTDAEAAATPGTVQAGIGSEEQPAALGTEFVPGDVAVAAGGAVTWNLAGPHTVSFNAPESARVLMTTDPDGHFHLSEEAVAPAGYEPPPPPEGESEGPPPTVDGGTFDGTGFLSSGILFDQPFTVVFSTAGTYEYACLIHPEMEGTVTVS